MQVVLDISGHYMDKVCLLLQWSNFPVFNRLKKTQTQFLKNSTAHRKQIYVMHYQLRNILHTLHISISSLYF